jgi:hypothetical protein
MKIFAWKHRSGECSFMQTMADKNEELAYRRIIKCFGKK